MGLGQSRKGDGVTDDLVVCIPCYNELQRRGEVVLRRMLDSLSRSMSFLARTLPGVDVYVACYDDASTDGTGEFVEAYFGRKDWFRLVRGAVSRYAGFARNVAATLFPTSLICLLDADDEYKEDHLAVCFRAMNQFADREGRKFGMAATQAEFSESVHPDWATGIAVSIPVTKVIRREVWEFVEGMPVEQAYRWAVCEDAVFVESGHVVFPRALVTNITTKYWNYPGLRVRSAVEEVSEAACVVQSCGRRCGQQDSALAWVG